MMPSDFPLPFAGIRYSYEFDTPEDFAGALAHLTSCHGHNFAVEGGRWTGRPAIWGSELAMECLKEYQANHKSEVDDEYDRAETFFLGVLKNWFEQHTATRRREMPGNIAKDVRRALQKSGLTLVRR